MPSTSRRAANSMLAMDRSTCGSRNRIAGRVAVAIRSSGSSDLRLRSFDDVFEEPVDDSVGVEALGLGGEIREHAVAQDRMCDRSDILDRRLKIPAKQRATLGPEGQILPGPRAGAP